MFHANQFVDVVTIVFNCVLFDNQLLIFMIFKLECSLLCFQNEQKVAFFGLQNATVEVLPDGSVSFPFRSPNKLVIVYIRSMERRHNIWYP